MILKRLTKTQKDEILKAYRAGDNSNALAEKYGCTPTTINRTVKTLLSDAEYIALKEERARIVSKKRKLINKNILKEECDDIANSKSLISFKEKVQAEDQDLKKNDDLYTPDLDEIPFLALDDAEDFGDENTSQSQNKNNI